MAEITQETEVKREYIVDGFLFLSAEDAAAAREELKKVMLVEGQGPEDITVYGKTGMGMDQGIVVDAWFTGFAEKDGETVYFCVHLGRTDGREVSSPAAREIAFQIIHDYYAGL